MLVGGFLDLCSGLSGRRPIPIRTMEWCIPIQTLQVENVQLGGITHGLKPILPLAYKEADLHFPALSILLPTLTIRSYDPGSGRLVLSLPPGQALSKLQTLQDMVLTAVNFNYRSWFPGQRKKPTEIEQGFQPMIHNQELHLYCPIYETMAQPIPMYQGGTWIHGKPKPGSLKTGMSVRVAVRLYGISFHLAPTGTKEWTGKFRLQHKIIGVITP